MEMSACWAQHEMKIVWHGRHGMMVPCDGRRGMLMEMEGRHEVKAG